VNREEMATCYRCGRPIPSTEFKLRRKVKTGETIRRRYPNPNISSLRTTFGIRVVCAVCARSIDREIARGETIQWLTLGVALVVLFALLLARFIG
jgi:hypothetical protein